jgi:hypothetical protein
MLQSFYTRNFSLMFASKARAYLSGAPLEAFLLALPGNIRLGWNDLSRMNALVYYEYFSNYTPEKFNNIGPR